MAPPAQEGPSGRCKAPFVADSSTSVECLVPVSSCLQQSTGAGMKHFSAASNTLDTEGSRACMQPCTGSRLEERSHRRHTMPVPCPCPRPRPRPCPCPFRCCHPALPVSRFAGCCAWPLLEIAPGRRIWLEDGVGNGHDWLVSPEEKSSCAGRVERLDVSAQFRRGLG
jgi:hypothetical protein